MMISSPNYNELCDMTRVRVLPKSITPLFPKQNRDLSVVHRIVPDVRFLTTFLIREGIHFLLAQSSSHRKKRILLLFQQIQDLSGMEQVVIDDFREPFLKIMGVGFKARPESEGRLLFLKLGYSHDVELTVPPAVRVFCFKPNIVCCTGIDKERVYQFVVVVHSCKPPEVYKGKCIMYVDEVIKKKQKKKSR
ncbi:unnamed protein product [Lactuca virosa]|uniref:Large ribosomal subunit protein uL6 alpha-beta domain-containing protein n=1 Tax=Lactuca virosa TaxID=75947 RepID=A0AAU9N416_9ASTR|nr:unnamed protein product [Lactuca virosa]